MKSVAIVGAGPAGLVAAKNLIRNHPGVFNVTVFEKQDRVGGMWALRPGELRRGKCNPEMPTNLSRFTVSYSDLAWESVDLRRLDKNSGEYQPAQSGLPLYPRAWQVGRYLEEYAQRFLPRDSIRASCQITRARKIIEGDCRSWEVSWKQIAATDRDESADGEPHRLVDQTESLTENFDYLVIGAGFFNTPPSPSFEVKADAGVNVLHSSQFRVLEDLVPRPNSDVGKIVVIGGGISGAEVAVAIAMAQSNAQNAPSQTKQMPSLGIHHVTSRPFYDVPRFHAVPDSNVSSGEMDRAPHFLPNDLSMFDLSRRPPGDIVPRNGLAPPEEAERTHRYIQSIIGGNQNYLGSPGMTISAEDQSHPPFIGITDNYTEFVRSGDIVTTKGRALSLRRGNEGGTAILQVEDNHGQRFDLDHVVGVVYATGYTPHPALEWLDPEIRASLGEDKRSSRIPLILDHHTTFHPAHEDLAFVGFYEGPFWGVMEMQAREIAARWGPEQDVLLKELGYAEPNMQEIRTAMLNRAPNVPQFWMGDYLAIVEAMARRHEIFRVDDGFGDRAGPISAARYAAETDDKIEVGKNLADLRKVLEASVNEQRFVAGAVFYGLQGRWYITRQLESLLPGFPSGTFTGTASFHPRFPTATGYDAEYLYVEEGSLQTHDGLTLKAKKRYAYRYSEGQDKLSVWFIKDDGKTNDYFFHDISISPKSAKSQHTGWQATGTHLCEKDNYDSSYDFSFRSSRLHSLCIRFVVKGPHKDYVSTTRFARPRNE